MKNAEDKLNREGGIKIRSKSRIRIMRRRWGEFQSP